MNHPSLIPITPFQEEKLIQLPLPDPLFLEKVGSIIQKVTHAETIALSCNEKTSIESSLAFPIDRYMWLSFAYTPIEKEFLIAIHEGDLALFFAFFCAGDSSLLNSTFFYPFMEALCLQISKQSLEENLFSQGSLSFCGIESLPSWSVAESFSMVLTLETPKVVVPLLAVFPDAFTKEYQRISSALPVDFSKSPLFDLPIKGGCSIGYTEVEAFELKELREGDFFLVDHLLFHPETQKGLASLYFENNFSAHIRYKDTQIKVVEILQNREPVMSNTWDNEDEAFKESDDDSLSSFDTLSLEVHIELDSFTYPLNKLLSLKEGSILEDLSLNVQGPLFLVCRGKKFAQGQLVEKEGHILFRVLKLHGTPDESLDG